MQLVRVKLGIKWRVVLYWESATLTEQNQISRMSSIEWASVSKYLHWLEVQSELTPFSISAVYSFGVGKGGFGDLASRKRRLLNLIEGNVLNLQSWVKANESEMTEPERAFARSLWRTTKLQMEIVREHIDRAVSLEKATKSFEIPQGEMEECGDELPF